MKEEMIEQMAKAKRLKLSFWKACTHYWPVLFVFLPPLFTCYSLLEIYVFDTYDGVRSAHELIATTWIWIPVGMLVWIIQWYRLRFVVISTAISSEEFNEALDRTVRELNWKIETKKKFSVRAFRNSNFTGSWGEMITIFYENGKLYLNAIPDPYKYAALTTFGWCKKDRVTFLKNLREVKENVPEKELLEKEEGFMTKLTFWAILARIFIYPFVLGLMFIGGYIIYDSGKLLLGIPLIAIAATFLFTDIKIMLGKMLDT